MIPHTTRELVAFFFCLVQQLRHLFRLFADFSSSHLSGAGIGAKQPEPLNCGRNFVPFHDAGRFPEFLIPVILQHLKSRPAAVTGNDDISSIFFLPDPDGLLQSAEGDIVCQLRDTAKLIEVVGVFIQLRQRDILDLLQSGVRSGHILENVCKIKGHCQHLRP